jgi:organic hydroperoxide reductase OsmC/OhrA
MKPYPHTYQVSAAAGATGLVRVASPGLAGFDTAPPADFDGPGDQWSPETLLCAAVADCFVLSFRGVSRAAKFEWESLECHVDGVLERVAAVTRFTRFTTRAKLAVKPGADQAKAHELLERAEKVCLIANSLLGERLLEIKVVEVP